RPAAADGQTSLDAGPAHRARANSKGRRSEQDGRQRYPHTGAGARRQISRASVMQLEHRNDTSTPMWLTARLVIVTPMVVASHAAHAQMLTPWRNALIEPKADAGFYLMASERGFFEKEGLKVTTLKVKDDTIGFKAVLSGEVDSYLGTAGALA